MPLNAKDYARAQAKLAAPKEDSGLSDEDRSVLLQFVQEYDDSQIAAQAPAVPEGTVFDRMGNPSQPAQGGPQVSDLNPDLPLLPQALAAEPAVAGPGEVDPQGWLAKPPGESDGTVFVYEPPLAQVKQRLMENPQLIATYLPDLQQLYTPDRIAALTTSDGIYQTIADADWKEAADAARKGGKTAYRYSKAPWLQGGQGLSSLEALGHKVVASAAPLDTAIQSFVLGVDDLGYFGAGGKTSDALGMEDQNREAVSEYPELHRVGQAFGMFNPLTASNQLYDFVASGGRALAPEAGLIGRTLLSGASGAVAGGVTQAAEEGVDAASAMLQGEQPSRPIDALRRIGGVAELSGGLGMLGEGIGQVAGAGAERLAEGSLYRGLPGRLERGGVKFSPISGPQLTPETEELIKRARELDVNPRGLAAQDIAPEIGAAAKAEVTEAIAKVEEQQHAFYQTREGRAELPATRTVETSLDILRAKHGPEATGKLSPNAPSAVRGRVQGLLNGQLAGVSVRPTEGAIAIPLEEAEAFLNPTWKQTLRREVTTMGDAPARREGGGPQPYGPAQAGGVETRQAVDRTLLPEHGPEREARPGIGPDKAIPGQPFNDTRGELARAGETEKRTGIELGPEQGPPREAEPGMGLEGRPLPGEPFNDTRGELAREGHVTADRTIDVLGVGAVASAATSDDEDTRTAAAGAGALLPLLRKRGLSTVYLVPKRHNAAKHEQLIRDIKGFHIDTKSEPPRELMKLDEAARQDRDQRPMSDQEGGWSALQNEHERLLGDSKAVDRLVNQSSPEGAYNALVGHGQQNPGELPAKEAVERAAEKAGKTPELQRLRLLDPLLALRDAANPFGSSGGVRPARGGIGGVVSAVAGRVMDPATIRALPLARGAGAEGSAIRGGRAGAAARIGSDEEQPSGPPSDLRGLPVNDPRVQQWLKSRKKEARP